MASVVLRVRAKPKVGSLGFGDRPVSRAVSGGVNRKKDQSVMSRLRKVLDPTRTGKDAE